LLNIANDVVVTICDPSVSTCSADFTVQADVSGTDLVGDVMGYFKLLPSTLASGKTLTGTYAVAGNGAFFVCPIQFQVPLASAPSAPAANFIPAGGASTTNCPGTATSPAALPGNLCVYEAAASGINRTLDCIGAASTGTCNASDTFGATIGFFPAGAGSSFSYGTWAVTAP
jgi:hypothetical protein